MMYDMEDPAEERDHIVPWRHLAIAMVVSVLALVVLSPAVAVLWLLASPKTGEDLPPPAVAGPPA